MNYLRQVFTCFVVTMISTWLFLPSAFAVYQGPGLIKAPLITQTSEVVGIANVWNTKYEFRIRLVPNDSWELRNIQIYVGNEPVPATKKGNLIPGKFNYKDNYANRDDEYWLQVDMENDLGITWGSSGEDKRLQNVAVHISAVKLDAEGNPGESQAAWAYTGEGVSTRLGEIDEETLDDFEGVGKGWWFTYQVGHPKRGHFIDAPVSGLTYTTPTNSGVTDESGAFEYFPDEMVSLYLGPYLLGSTLAADRISPLDLFEMADTDDIEVINMARLLQSLDSEGFPNDGILISPEVVQSFAAAMANLGLANIDFFNSEQINSLISETIYQASLLGVQLYSVDATLAKANLDRALDSTMFRKNVSRTPTLTSSKSKLNIMGVWFPALKADGSDVAIEYFDENGSLLRTVDEAKPIVVAYTDGVEATGYQDIYAAISRDDGNTFKRANLSRTADLSSFDLANGEAYYGEAKKPVFQVKGNNILVAWTSKFCRGGKPAYAIDPEDDYSYDDPFYTDDIWGVGGPQRSIDYTELDYPEVGEVPYSCVWTARGVVASQKNVDQGLGEYPGDIVWFKPERLTSGRRDANQVFMGAADGAGFAIAWQEDPEGLRPGDADGPGPGWGGATTNHKTDIWYSYIRMADFSKVDTNFVSGGDPEHEVAGRPKALVPMSLPVRVTDNDAANTDNLLVELDGSGTPIVDEEGDWIPIVNSEAIAEEADGTHAYAYEIEGLCEDFYEFTNEQGALKKVCITADNRLLDGDTGASRPNLFLQPYTKADGSKSAWAILAYEETKGVGSGSPDHVVDGGPYGDDYVAEEGKNAIYHSFDFQNPDLVSAGDIINLPERNASGSLLYVVDENGARILDWQGLPQLAYENARRPRFILQGKSAAGASGTVMLVLYKEGQEGSGRPSDIMLRRVVSATPGNPYAYKNFVCDATEIAANGVEVCVDGTQNMSSVSPTETTDSMGDPNVDDPYGAVKVVAWGQSVENLDDPSWLNPYDDARAHRGGIRGDFVVMGYSYTPNWAAARNGNDKYDFFVRRSFDGGQTWTTDPAGDGLTHCKTWTDPISKEKTEECSTYAAGAFEEARNLSQLPNNKESVIEPRIVPAPGTIKVDGVWTGKAEDKQNPNVFYVSYGTSTNPKKDPETGEQDAPYPLDLYYSFSTDRGENYVEVAWDVNPDSDGNYAGETIYRWDYLAKGDPEQGEAQLRMTPNGERFYATWLQEIEPVDPESPTHFEGSDIWFRRIMSPVFPANVAND